MAIGSRGSFYEGSGIKILNIDLIVENINKIEDFISNIRIRFKKVAKFFKFGYLSLFFIKITNYLKICCIKVTIK